MLAHKSGSGPVPRSESDENGEETELLARVAAGESEAFRGLVDRHLPTVLAIARRMLRDDAEAEDVAQDTMLRLWRNAAGLELGPHGVRPWLRRVASNLCIDRVRARRNTTVVEEVPEESAPRARCGTWRSVSSAHAWTRHCRRCRSGSGWRSPSSTTRG